MRPLTAVQRVDAPCATTLAPVKSCLCTCFCGPVCNGGACSRHMARKWRLIAIMTPLGSECRLDGSTQMLKDMCLPCRLAAGGRHPVRHCGSSVP